jgi:hypothetical protein
VECLCMNLKKHRENLNVENCTILVKEGLVFCIRKLNIVKISLLF